MATDRPYSTDPFPAVPTPAEPGEAGTCVACGLDFEQQGEGITAGNFCEWCWPLRNLNFELALKRAKRDAVLGDRIAAGLFWAFILFWIGYFAWGIID